jgi:hypothetical protein
MYKQAQDYNKTVAQASWRAVAGAAVGRAGAAANGKNRGGALIGVAIGAGSGRWAAVRPGRTTPEEAAVRQQGAAPRCDHRGPSARTPRLERLVQSAVGHRSDTRKIDEISADLAATDLEEASRTAAGGGRQLRVPEAADQSLKEARDEWIEVAEKARADQQPQDPEDGRTDSRSSCRSARWRVRLTPPSRRASVVG